MAVIPFAVAAIVIVAVVAICLVIQRRGKAQGGRGATQSQGGDVFLGLRNQALHASRVELGLASSRSATEPWGVLMETGYERASVTVASFVDGNASIYLSTGGGFIGGIGHESVRQAAVGMVRVAATHQSQMARTDTFPLPVQGETVFYLRTDEGVLSASALEKDLADQRHALSPLFFAGQEVITQYRLLEGKK